MIFQKLLKCLLFSFAILCSTDALSGSKWVRLSWQNDAATEATVTFSPSGSNNNAYVKYGYSTTESSWSTESVTFQTDWGSGAIVNKHVRLSALNSDTEVYFRICDDGGCGQRFYFRTAPTDNSPFVFVAGGDTRTGWTNRQNGNRLVAKLRPLFVMHGGDYTDANSVSQWEQWLIDWELSYSSDTINSLSYKRIYPLLATHGNHEDGSITTICRMLGFDTNRSNGCSAHDTYYDVSISPLLRVFTLNSQFMSQSSSLQSAQNNWLSSALSNADSEAWRVAQYHKPMFPHYTGKSDNITLFNWWAQDFYDYGMNLVVESDTHLTKLTEIVEPSGSNFAGSAQGVTAGTVYVGEGSWGAPARSANDAKSWTVDMASIQQFKVITVNSSNMEVRTAQFDGNPGSVSRSQRNSNATLLPSNVNWWQANGVGEALTLATDSANRSILAGGSSSGGGTTVEVSATDDTFITSNNANTNFDNSSEQLLADGADSAYGQMKALIAWELDAIPACATVELAKIQLSLFNPSNGTYNIYKGNNAWTESNATWNSVGGAGQQGNNVGTFSPGSTGLYTIQLNSAGVSMVQGWIQGSGNNGVVIGSGGTTDGIDFHDRENGPAPKLMITYNENQCASSGPTTVTLQQGAGGYSGATDTYVAEGAASTNYGNTADLLADNYDGSRLELISLLKWNVSSIPSSATVTEVKLEVDVFNQTNNTYNIWDFQKSWSEGSATWGNTNPENNRGAKVGNFAPTSKGIKTITLDADGRAMVQRWISGGANNGVSIESGGTSNGIDIRSSEYGTQNRRPKLIVTYTN